MIDDITVLLADDHALVRRGFRKILEDDEFIRVVGEASNGVEAIQKAQDLKPKVVVMDLSMPELDGVQATKEILKHVPETAVLVLSMHADDNYVRNALDAGARGYLFKNAIDVDLVGAIKTVAEGRRYMGSGLKYPSAKPTTRWNGLPPAKSRCFNSSRKASRIKRLRHCSILA